MFNAALKHHQDGRLAEAEDGYRKILESAPTHAEALRLLGIICMQTDRFDESLVLLARAIAANPDDAETHCNMANCLRLAEQPERAVDTYETALTFDPGHRNALFNRANLLRDLARWDDAEAAFNAAWTAAPDDAAIALNRANFFKSLARNADTVNAYQAVLRINPHSSDALRQLAGLMLDRGDAAEAARLLGRLIDAPHYDHESDQQKARDINNLGLAQASIGLTEPARRNLEKAAAWDPKNAKIHANLGDLLQTEGAIDEAVAAFEAALEIAPDNANALAQLIHQKQRLCDWKGLDQLIDRLGELINSDAGPVSPFLVAALPFDDATRLRCAKAWVRETMGWTVTARAELGFTAPAPAPDGRLRIGYLSADYHEHATSYLIAEMLERHDRARFEVFGYSCGANDHSPMRARVRSGFDHFRDIVDVSHIDAARLINTDQIDILVDLKGYTQNTRLEIGALRPAPVQVSYLGYPGTVGGDFLDYVIGDRIVTPMDRQPFYTECLVQMPNSYQINDRHRPRPTGPISRSAHGLPDQGTVFCCFNNTYKILPDTFLTWMTILGRTPGSVLWLMDPGPAARKNLGQWAQSHGIAKDRLVFAPTASLAQHLDRYRLADLFLDTQPYNAHTTASDALWMGCPVLTYPGDTFPSRVAASLIGTTACTDLVVADKSTYLELAVRLGTDSAALGDVKSRLVDAWRTSALFDAAQFTADIETAFKTMWARHRAGKPAKAFAVK